MLPPRSSRPSLADNPVVAVWNGAPIGGSAKSLGLIRTDSESTATVTRQHQGSKADWQDGSDTLDRKDKPKRTDDDEGPVTTMHVRSGLLSAAAMVGAAVSDIDEDLMTPVGVKKADLIVPSASNIAALNTTAETAIKTPMAMAVPATPVAPESGCTRVAPITVPPAGATATATPLTPPMSWAPQGPPGVNMQSPDPLQTLGRSLATKALTLPPHKLALGVSMMLMVAALMFVFVRARQPAPAAAAPQFPPPAELPLPPQMAFAPPPATLVLPNALPAPKEQAQPQAKPERERERERERAQARRPAPVRATSRTTTTIPVHREQ